ncbi:GMC family oxidoreductase [Luedemannella flava]|uniref:Cholesterol oxidase n=1 Tax=Luedemannella flava TaxID=349316 RepID=A0ABN2LE27_9ACTN
MYDVVIIGSGFGGSVAALRLAEKGYRVAVVEAGRRFADHELPRTSWRLRRFLWAPALGCRGIQRMDFIRGRRGAGGVLVLSGAGVGGGSLVYANTLYEPPAEVFADPQWASITDWATELAPHYDQASRMLGVTRYPRMTPADDALLSVARRLGVSSSFQLTPVGVHLGSPGVTVPDPYFGGVGPSRAGCQHCGSCMTGCRHNAKNTLVKNYLYLAERAGVEIIADTSATAVVPLGSGEYAVTTVRSGSLLRRRRRELRATQVIFAAGTLGTQRLLHRMRATGALPSLSDRVGALTRTNSEAVLGASVPTRAARKRGLDFTEGVAITSSIHPDADTHIESVRYGRGSNAMALLQTVLTDGGPRRARRWLATLLRHPVTAARTLSVRGWSQRTVVALVMQTLDNSLTLVQRRNLVGRLKLRATPGHGAPSPDWIPAGNRAARLLAEEIDGVPGGSVTEILSMPVTAHILGGAAIGASPASGVVDGYHRVFGHPGLHVVDGAAVPANLGVNPSLTIAALAERAMSFWPNVGEADPRPPLGEAYRPVAPVAPRSEAVPAGAPAALRRPRD